MLTEPETVICDILQNFSLGACAAVTSTFAISRKMIGRGNDMDLGKRPPQLIQQIILHKLHNYKFFDFMNVHKIFLFDLTEFHCHFLLSVRDPRSGYQLILLEFSNISAVSRYERLCLLEKR